MQTHKDLKVYNLSIELVVEVYSITKEFPKEELYGLTSQIRRSAVSVPSNIAEGAARNSKKEYIQFLYISLGSLSELETHFIISEKLSYLNSTEILTKIETIRKMLLSLIKYLKNK
jgi:four helix bundle protein